MSMSGTSKERSSSVLLFMTKRSVTHEIAARQLKMSSWRLRAKFSFGSLLKSPKCSRVNRMSSAGRRISNRNSGLLHASSSARYTHTTVELQLPFLFWAECPCTSRRGWRRTLRHRSVLKLQPSNLISKSKYFFKCRPIAGALNIRYCAG